MTKRKAASPYMPQTVWVSLAFERGRTLQQRATDELASRNEITVTEFAGIAGVTYKTARKAMMQLVAIGIAKLQQIQHGRGRPQIIFRINQDATA